jgi:NADP-dependent 3-hydroxy acid dehydrogenase YdfG
MPRDPSLTDRIAVVTGAGSGIGRATAIAFAAAGARVVACDVDPARLPPLAVALGDRALLVRQVDVADRAQMAAFAEEVPTADIVVNNAGVALGGSFLDTSLDDWDWLLGINLRGVIHGCHFFAPKLIARGGGSIVNVSSILGIYPAPSLTAYVASKFAVLGLSQSLRAELARHRVGVTAVCPGMIATQIIADGRLRGTLERRQADLVSRFRTRGLSPEKVADAIVAAVRTNPAVRIVGADAHLVHALTRVLPGSVQRIGATIARRFGATA